MKKIISILMMCFAFAFMANAATINYYVETSANGGDDANTGLTELDPMATVNAAFTAAKTSFTAAAGGEYVINVGVGTFTVSMMSIGDCNTNAFSLTFRGANADSTTIQGGGSLYSGVKLFNNLSGANGDNANLDIYLEDIAFWNFSNDYTGGIMNFNGDPANGATLNATRCVFKNLKAAEGAIVRSNHAASATFKDCSFIDIIGTKNAIFHFVRGQLSIENCVFDGCVRDYTGKTDDNAVGILVHSAPSNSWASTTISFINNTVVNSGIINTGSLTTSDDVQSLVKIATGSNGTTYLSIANNLICGTDYSEISTTYYDIDVDASYTKVNYNSSTNNILNSVSTYPITGSFVSDTLVYTSPEIDFIMDGSSFDYDTTSTGVIYVTALGDSVIDQGLTADQTTTDIVGTTRSEPGDIGAVEYLAPGEQVIQFNVIDPIHIDNAVDIVLEENSSVGLSITYVSSDESVATIIGGYTIHPVGEGFATISANQAGDATYNPAAEIEREVQFVGDTTVYYLRENGVDANNGLSVTTALATLAQGILEVKSNALSSVYILDIEGTVTGAPGDVVFNQTEDITLIIDGNSVGTMQATDDATWNAAAISESGSAGGRFFGGPYNNGSGGLHIIFEDLNIKNAGFTDNNGGVLFNMTISGKTAEATIRRCNVTNLMARSGAIAHLLNSPYTLTIEDSYFSNIKALNRDAVQDALIRTNKKSSLSITNSVFDGLTKSANVVSGTPNNSRNGGLLLSYESSVSGATLELTNNTFINNQCLRSEMIVDQSIVYVNTGLADLPVTIANNLFVGNSATTTSADYYDVNITATNTVALVDSTNNVMNSQNGLGTTDNIISSTITYDNDSVAFEMDGDYPKLFTAPTGVSYVKANGTKVFQGALLSAAPATDITGADRSATAPSVGAFEASAGVPTGLSAAVNSEVALYPNPATDVLYITGDVVKVELFNISGRMVQSSAIVAGSITISNLAQGLYFVKCQDETGTIVATERIVKR